MCLFMAMTMSWTPPALTTASFTSSFPATARIALRTCRTNSYEEKNISTSEHGGCILKQFDSKSFDLKFVTGDS